MARRREGAEEARAEEGPLRSVALLLAAGRGTRLAASDPKAFVSLGDRPLFAHSLAAMQACGAIELVVLVVPGSRVEAVRALVSGAADPSIEGASLVRAVVAGGEWRQDSVRLGLDAVPEDAEIVVCHDAARPFASGDLFRRVIGAVSGHPDAPEAAVPVVVSPDTVKRVHDGVVVETIPREALALAQTPQAFRAEPLRDAHARWGPGAGEATDDAQVMEAAGYRVVTVEGERGNFKVTTGEDLLLARWMLRRHLGRSS